MADKLMMRYATALFFTVSFFIACSEKDAPEPAIVKEVASQAETVEVAKDAGSDGEDTSFQDEGSVRPAGSFYEELEVERPSFPKPAPGTMVSIPGGTLLVGSSPADTMRVQYAENDLVQIEITPFQIDALPYPGDPDRAFLTNISLEESTQRCAEIGKRLCTELEWEWACKSADGRRYPFGNKYDEAAYPESNIFEPASPFGVFAMGRILEWTSSEWGAEADQVERGVARGFAEGLEEPPHRGRRCAKRWRRMTDGASPLLGFRCCIGEVNRATVVMEPIRPPHSKYKNMKPEKFARVIRSIPELAPVHDNPHMFSDGDIRAVLARRQSDRQELARQGIHFNYKPMRWIPRQGMELWVAVGRGGKHSFVVALHETKDNEEYVHASSLVLWNQPIPLALAYKEGHRDEMYWAPCWGCRDGGSITFDDEKNEVIITYKW